MRIGIDAHYVGIRFGGNEVFFENLINSLGQLNGEHEYEIYVTDTKLAKARIKTRSNIQLYRLWPNSIWTQRAITMPIAVYRSKIDVLHVPFIAPPICTAKVIITIHDLSYERYPEYFGLVDRLRMRFFVPLSVRLADAVITISEFSKKEIIELYGLPPAKIYVIPIGVNATIFRPISDRSFLEKIKNRYYLPQHFILFVGTIQPRKNLERLISAFDRNVQELHIPHHLVIVGNRGWMAEPIYSSARNSFSADRIRFLEGVSFSDLPALYNLADLFIYPSIYEGFGIPPLEAMACGVPVIASKTSSFPEVIGDAGLLVDPYQIDDIADAIKELVQNKDLCDEIVLRGQERSRKFSWMESAQFARRLYKKVGS